MSVYRNRNFILTYAASFISIFGSKLLMMSYVAYIFEARGSATLASIVFAAEWTTCLVVGLFGTRYIDGVNARNLLVKLNVMASMITLSFAFFTDPALYKYAIAIIFARALLSHAINSSRIKGLVQFFTEKEMEIFTPIFNSSLFIATALAGATGVYVLRYIELSSVVYIAVGTFLLAASLFAMVRPVASRLEESLSHAQASKLGAFAYIGESFRIMAANRDLASAVFYIIISVTSFQATYEIVMTVIPQVWFKLGKSGTALFFTFESLFVTSGAFLYQILHRRGLINATNQKALNLGTVVFAAMTYLILPQLQYNLYACLIVFNTMVIAVELIWTHQFKQMIANIPAKKLAAVTGLQMAMGYSLMGVFAFVFSLGLDRFGLTTALYLNIGLLVALVFSWESLMKAPTGSALPSTVLTKEVL